MVFTRYLTNRAFGFAYTAIFFIFTVFIIYSFNSAFTNPPVDPQDSSQLSRGNKILSTAAASSVKKSSQTDNFSKTSNIESKLAPQTDKSKLDKDPKKEGIKDKAIENPKPTTTETDKTDAIIPDPLPVTTLDDSLDHYTYCQATNPNATQYSAIENSTLLSVHLMTRHGDRSPTVFLPFGLEKDPWICNPESTLILDPNSSYSKFTHRETVYDQDACASEGYCSVNPLQPLYWPGNCSSGQLTPKGSHQLYKLGGVLKSIYIDKLSFLNNNWNQAQKDIFVRSTNVWRTQQSATSLISGMFSSSVSKLSGLSIYTMPSEIETTVSNRKGCPKIVSLENEIKSSQTFKNYLASIEHERTEFENILGEPRIGDYKDTVDYYVDTFQARSCNGFSDVCKAKDSSNKNSTACVSKTMIDKMMEYGNAESRIFFRDHPTVFPLVARLRMGGFLLEIKRNLLLGISKHSGESLINTQHPDSESDPSFAFPPVFSDDQFKKKFFYYSAHDTSLSALLGALHSQNMRWPPYASNFIFELWSKNSNATDKLVNYSLRMIYNGEAVRTPWCVSGVCPVSAFLNYLDTSLGVVGGFEKYGIFLTKEKSPPVWNYLHECWVS